MKIEEEKESSAYLSDNPNVRRAFTPPGCMSSPTMRSGSAMLRSMTVTRRPWRARAVARAAPPTPHPTITTSQSEATACFDEAVACRCLRAVRMTMAVTPTAAIVAMYGCCATSDWKSVRRAA